MKGRYCVCSSDSSWWLLVENERDFYMEQPAPLARVKPGDPRDPATSFLGKAAAVAAMERFHLPSLEQVLAKLPEAELAALRVEFPTVGKLRESGRLTFWEAVPDPNP